MGRIRLLKESEIIAFDLPIELTNDQRESVFKKSLIELSDLTFKKTIAKIGFIIQSGYFLINNKFFK